MKKNYFIWGASCLIFCAFIAALSYWLPYGGDEFLFYNSALKETFFNAIDTFLHISPRFGAVAGCFLLYMGKWSFVLLNPLAQLGIVFSVFYLVFLRLPDFKTLRDIWAFCFILLASVFFVITPDQTVFWIGGALNYSWTFLLFLVFAGQLRNLCEGNCLHGGLWVCAAAAAAGFCLGISNENNAPLSLLLFGGVWLFLKTQKRKAPAWFLYAFFALCVGLVFMFASPALYMRLRQNQGEVSLSLGQIIFFNIYKFDLFFRSAFYLPFILFFAYIFFLRTRFKEVLRNKNFVLAVLSFCFAVCAALPFLILPSITARVFYSASLFTLISFLFFLNYLGEVYRKDFYKIIFYAFFAFVVFNLPMFVFPYYHLHEQDLMRSEIVRQAKEKGSKEVFFPVYKVIYSPVKNYRINFYNPPSFLQENILRHYGLEQDTVLVLEEISPRR